MSDTVPPSSAPATDQAIAAAARTGLDLGISPLAGAAVTPELGRAPKKKLGIGAKVSIFWLGLLIVLALAAPILPLKDPINYSNAFLARQGPSLAHPFGLDANGRDLLSRVAWGARASLIIGFGSITIGFIVGGVLGLVSGYFKGRIGELIGALFDVMLAIPAIILAVALVTFLSGSHTTSWRSIFNITLALAIVGIPILGRITRASVLTWSEREFVTAARAQGARHVRIMFKEILPNVLPAMFSLALLAVAVAIVAEGGLAILGASVKAPTPSWGNIIQGGQTSLNGAPGIILFPCLFIFLTVLALNHLGDVVRARFDVREAGI